MSVPRAMPGWWWAKALVALVCASAAAAQSPGTPSIPTITPPELARYLDVLAADSLRGPTPSPGLDRTVRFLAGEWRALGLRPGLSDRGDSAWVQRYPLPGQLQVDYTTAGLAFASTPHGDTVAAVSEGGHVPWHPRGIFTFATDARFLSPIMPAPLRRLESPYKPTVLVAGPHTIASVRAADVATRAVLYIPPADADSATTRAILQILVEQSAGVVVLSPTDSAHFAAQVQAGAARPAVFADDYLPQAVDRSWLAQLRAETLRATLALNGIDLTAVQAARTPLVQPLPFLLVRLTRNLPKTQVTNGVTAPNVMAMLPGRDTALQPQWIVVTASLDGAGPDGAPNTLGLAGLLALARAFAAPAAQPRRSLLFVATSGREAEFAGSRVFARWLRLPALYRQAEAKAVVTLDLVGQASRDSVAIDGLRDLAFAPASSPATMALLHSELGLSLVDTGSVLSSGSNAAAFIERWLPTLSVRTVGSPVPSGEAADAGARLLRLVYYIVDALANAEPEELPAWTAAAKSVLLARPAP